MSKSDKSRRPRYTGYGRPVYHEHGSRRALIEQQDSRSAILEQDDEPLADWERELLYGSPVSEVETVVQIDDRPLPPRPGPNPFNIGMGFIPNSQRQPTWEERDRLAREREAKRDAWIASVKATRASEQALDTLRDRLGGFTSNLRPTDPAKRITVAHRIRVTDVALMIGLTNVQTIYLLNTICKEYVPHANATVASIVATDLLKLVSDKEDFGGRTFVRQILMENDMGDIDA